MALCVDLKSRFPDFVIPRLLSTSCFGPGTQIVNFDIDPERKGEDQFSSAVQFFQLKVRENSDLRIINVVVKFQPEGELLRKSLRTKLQFLNEVFMYSEIFPIIDKNEILADIFPKYYHGLADMNLGDDSDYIVLEDLSKKHYRLTSERVFLDYDHCILVLKEIGRFHALSYAAKKHNASKFKEAMKCFHEKWNTERLLRWRYMMSLCGQRGVLPLINEPQHKEILTNFLKNYDDPVRFYSSLVDPVEPEAVLCHGDFCRNNMLFSYDNAGKPISVKFFDLQTPRYSSPVIDLSFFLLMNTRQETREKYWDDFLNVYKQSIKSVVPDIDVPELDFGRVAIYGYIHCSFFLPMMVSGESEARVGKLEDFLKLSPYEQGVTFSQIGGENETKYLVDIVQFLLSRGYIRGSYF